MPDPGIDLLFFFIRLTPFPDHAHLSLRSDAPPRLRQNTTDLQEALGKDSHAARRPCELGTGERPASASDGRILDRKAGFHFEVDQFELGHDRDRDDGQNVHSTDEDTRGRGDYHETTACNMVY